MGYIATGIMFSFERTARRPAKKAPENTCIVFPAPTMID
jgi:hypothetical protein